jgi:hypothetical protein
MAIATMRILLSSFSHSWVGEFGLIDSHWLGDVQGESTKKPYAKESSRTWVREGLKNYLLTVVILLFTLAHLVYYAPIAL